MPARFWNTRCRCRKYDKNVFMQQQFLTQLKKQWALSFPPLSVITASLCGGKSLAVGYVVEQIPIGTTQLVSPFLGGGSVEIACANELGMRVRGYDVFDMLTNYWVHQLRQPRKLADRIAAWQPTDKVYRQVKERLRAHWKGEKTLTDALELAAHYWFNHNLSYGPGFLGWMSKIYQQQDRFERLVDKVRNFRAPNLSVEHASFETTIAKHNGDFLYCDPPYFLAGDSKMFKGIYPQRNFPIHHKGFDHEKLCNLLHRHRGGFVLSYNDCAVIRDWYADFKIVEVAWQYTLGQGETRIGKNRLENGTNHHVKRSHELLIVKDA